MKKYAVRISLGGEESLMMWINYNSDKDITQEKVKEIVNSRIQIAHRELIEDSKQLKFKD